MNPQTSYVGTISTRQVMANIAAELGNGKAKAKAARLRLNQLPGTRSEWNDPHADHRDRDLFVVSSVVKQMCPDDLESQQTLLRANQEIYVKQSDRNAIKYVPAKLIAQILPTSPALILTDNSIVAPHSSATAPH